MDVVYREGSLGAILFKSDIITEGDIKSALAEQQRSGCRFGEALVRLGIVAQEDIDWALSTQLNIPFVRLRKELIDNDAAHSVTGQLARLFNLIPLIRSGDELSIAIADPLDQTAIEAVTLMTGCRVAVSVALCDEIREMHNYFYGETPDPALLEFSSNAFQERIIAEINADQSGARFLDHLMHHAVQERLEAVSLQPLTERVQVLTRKEGIAREIGSLTGTGCSVVSLRLSKLAGMENHSDGLPAQGMLPYSHNEERHFFQVLRLRGKQGDYLTLKPSVPYDFSAGLGDLELSQEKRRQIRALAAASQGMVLLSMRQAGGRRRLTELFLRECATAGKTVLMFGENLGGWTNRFPCIPFPKGLPGGKSETIIAALEHNPDVMVIPDATETDILSAAARAALSGVYVVAGLSIHGTYNTWQYLRCLARQDLTLSAALLGTVTCSRLQLPCPVCTGNEVPPDGEPVSFVAANSAGNHRATGCILCHDTGRRGGTYVLDVVPVDAAMSDALAPASDSENLRRCLTERNCHGVEGTLSHV